MVELHKMGLLCFLEFNQYVVGFANPSYPQNYPQKIRGGFWCPAPDVRGSLAE